MILCNADSYKPENRSQSTCSSKKKSKLLSKLKYKCSRSFRGNFAFQNGFGLTTDTQTDIKSLTQQPKTANPYSPWAYIWEGLIQCISGGGGIANETGEGLIYVLFCGWEAYSWNFTVWYIAGST